MTALIGEVEARRAWIAALCDSYAGEEGHIGALCVSARAMLARAEPAKRPMEALELVVGAERYLRLAFELENQRRGQFSSETLAFASSAARDGYKMVLRRARSLGVAPRRSDAGAPVGRWADPAVLLAPMRTPATYVRGGTVGPLEFRSEDRRDLLPFPVVMLPWYPKEALRALSIVQHEIGHNLAEDLRLTKEVGAAVEAALRSEGVSDHERATWGGWGSELVADTFGTMLAGAAFAVELIGWGTVVSGTSATHPPPPVRIAVCNELLALFEVPAADAIRQRLAAVATHQAVAPFTERARQIARAMLTSALPGLGGAALIDLAPQVAGEHAMLVGAAATVAGVAANPTTAAAPTAALAEGEAIQEQLLPIPLRLLPSLAAFAIDVGGDPAQVAQLLFVHASRRPQEATAPFRAELFERRTLRAMRAPILDEARGGLKVPPRHLFAAVRSVVFVGATNDGLPVLFQQYASAGGAAKERIEIFFLTERAARTLAHPGRDANALAQGRCDAIDALTPTLLSRVARSWSVYEHDDPFFFASYWDANAVGGRIHTSSYGPGQDLQRAPSVDYVWPPSEPAPGRSYRWYLDALAGLRAHATVLAASR